MTTKKKKNKIKSNQKKTDKPVKKRGITSGKKGKTTGSRKKGKEIKSLRTPLAALFLIAFIIISLLVLTRFRQQHQQPPAVVEQESIGNPEQIGEDVRVEIESALLRSGVVLDQLESHYQGDIFRYEISGEMPPADILKNLNNRLQRITSELTLDKDKANRTISIFLQKTELAHLRFNPAVQPDVPPEIPPATTRTKPQVAIIMDDLGENLSAARKLLSIPLEVTFAILPNTGHARETAELSHAQNRETLIHLPMEPINYPKHNPGRNALFTNMDSGQIKEIISGYIAAVPYAIGGNNHMGSRFTENKKAMQSVLQTMRNNHLFFVDSRTSGRSIAYAQAREMGIATATRDRFLDNIRQVDTIRSEIRSLVRLAQKKGQAIGICHPYPETLAALQQEQNYIKTQGVDVVPISRLLVR